MTVRGMADIVATAAENTMTHFLINNVGSLVHRQRIISAEENHSIGTGVQMQGTG